MNNALTYVIGQIGSDVFLFFRHWYYDAFFAFFRAGRFVARGVERRVAFVVTLRHFFQPLYQDYSFIGYLFGPAFRFMRLVIGAAAYAVVLPPIIAAGALWALAPVAVFFKIFLP